MKIKMILASLISVCALNAFAHEEVPNQITISKATELGVHRIERLVTLKKIDENFRVALVAMKAERTTENGAVFKVEGYQAAGADGSANVVTLWMDADGKTLSFTVTEGASPSVNVQWPDKDSVSLIEEGLHFVLEGWVVNPEVKAFYTGLESITMAAVQDAQGALLAEYKVTSDDDSRVLTIHLKPDGTFVDFEIK